MDPHRSDHSPFVDILLEHPGSTQKSTTNQVYTFNDYLHRIGGTTNFILRIFHRGIPSQITSVGDVTIFVDASSGEYLGLLQKFGLTQGADIGVIFFTDRISGNN